MSSSPLKPIPPLVLAGINLAESWGMASSNLDEHFMRLAVERARSGLTTPGGAEVGCVVVLGGQVAATGFTEVELQHDPTAHAEIVTLRKLSTRRHAFEFPESTLYCTLQPCGMCTLACVWARVSRIVYGARRIDVDPVYFDTRHFDTADLVRDAFDRDIQVTGGVLASPCRELYSPARPSSILRVRV